MFMRYVGTHPVVVFHQYRRESFHKQEDFLGETAQREGAKLCEKEGEKM
jgi:hypothetical protein